MQAAITIIGRFFGQRGFASLLAGVGAEAILTEYDDLTKSQAQMIDVCARDPRMQKKAQEVLELYEKIKVEQRAKGVMVNAEPWYGDITS